MQRMIGHPPVTSTSPPIRITKLPFGGVGIVAWCMRNSGSNKTHTLQHLTLYYKKELINISWWGGVFSHRWAHIILLWIFVCHSINALGFVLAFCKCSTQTPLSERVVSCIVLLCCTIVYFRVLTFHSKAPESPNKQTNKTIAILQSPSCQMFFLFPQSPMSNHQGVIISSLLL